MLRIMLPCYLVKEQLAAKLALLRQLADGEITSFLAGEKQKFAIGLEIGTNMESFLQPDFFDKGRRLLAEADLPKDLFLSFHGPQFMEETCHSSNFFCGQQGFKNLLRTIDFARLIEADLVNVHAHQSLQNHQINALNQKELMNLKHIHLRTVRDTLTKLRYEVGLTPIICIENVPHNYHNDRYVDPAFGLYELAFVDPADYAAIISPQKNIFACIDVCHLAQVYDSSELLDKIVPLGTGVRHVHLSDLKGAWHPFISTCQEGRIPGTGRIGETVFFDLLCHFLWLSQQVDINLVLEINDSDFVAIKETTQALNVLLDNIASIPASAMLDRICD